MLNIERDITKVYSGKHGCMCGCMGKYTVSPHFRKLVGDQRGYPVDDDEVNARSVKIIANKVLKDPNAIWEDNHVYVVDSGANRVRVVWFI